MERVSDSMKQELLLGLSGKQLNVVSSGCCTDSPSCPDCKTDDNVVLDYRGSLNHWRCTCCGKCWTTKFQ